MAVPEERIVIPATDGPAGYFPTPDWSGWYVGGTFSLARWREIQEVFDAFETWLSTPLAGCGVPPIVVVSRRGNPPEPAAPPDPEPTPEPTPEEPAP